MAELTSDLLEAARQSRQSAVVELLAIYYPVVWRMSVGLTGREDVGRGVTRHLMQRSLKALAGWKDEAAPTRWFHHHTLLTVRRTYRHAPDALGDTLLPPSSNDPRYAAFIKALRSLPMQQREAFILSHGEKLDIRAIAVAMDCSVLAAGNHLSEAGGRLRQLDAPNLDVHALRLSKVYRSLSPNEELALKEIRKRVTRFYVPARIKRVVKAILAAMLFGVSCWGTYRVWQIVRHSMSQ